MTVASVVRATCRAFESGVGTGVDSSGTREGSLCGCASVAGIRKLAHRGPTARRQVSRLVSGERMKRFPFVCDVRVRVNAHFMGKGELGMVEEDIRFVVETNERNCHYVHDLDRDFRLGPWSDKGEADAAAARMNARAVKVGE